MIKDKNIFRELIYQEKSRNEDFGIDQKDSVDQIIFDKYLLTREDLKPGEPNFYKRTLKIFNDAHFICTLILSYPNFKYNLSYFKSNVSLPSVVIPLAHFYLSKVNIRTLYIDRFLIMIETEGKSNADWKLNYDDIKVIEDEYKFTIEPSYFSRQEINPELLSSIQWWRATNGFKFDRIKKIIAYIAKDKQEACMIADAIKDAAKECDNNIRPECYFDDEKGCFVEYTPKSLKSQGVYDLCDEIKESYEQILSRTMDCSDSTEETKKLESNKATSKKYDKYSVIFDEKLNISAIADEIKKITGYSASSRIFFKALYDVFSNIHWLKEKISTKFIKWAKSQDLASFEGNDFKKVNQNSVIKFVNDIKEHFILCDNDGRITDKDNFIKTDPKGNILKKINK